jgi:adenylate cyclase
VNKRLRDALVAGIIALAAGLAFAVPSGTWLDGLSLDLLFWLRERVAPASHGHSPTVVIALDEETYRREPFKDVPRAMWTPQLAKVLNATLDAGAKVVGFDLIYPTTIDTYIRGYERDWLLALRRAAREGRLVLGKVQHQAEPILPHVGALRIVGEDNVRSLNAHEEEDGVVRRMPLMFDKPDSGREPSFALDLAVRATGAKVERTDAGLSFGDFLVPGSRDGTIALRFVGGARDVPTYSLADLAACIDKGDEAFLRQAFQGRIVLVAVVLDVEDRKLTSKRLITGGPGAASARCALAPLPGIGEGQAVRRDTVPGVYLHATAINNLIDGSALRHAGRPARLWATTGVALIAGALAFTLSPWLAGAGVIVLGAAWIAAATAAFINALVLPLLTPLLAAATTFGLQWGYRFIVADRDKRFLRDVFQRYLAPAVVDQLVEGQRLPELGGETRELTVWFSDVESFSKIAERLGDPHALVDFMNKYLTEMTSIVKEHGGFVDKYIGDAIVAVFGAPLADPAHARQAVASVLACQARLAQIQTVFMLPPDLPVLARAGINTGEMLVGNIGSRDQFNYTVMGDAVNLASRIEGANKAYGIYAMVSDTTRRACGDAFAFRELDTVRVVGREAPLTLYEPLTREQAEARRDMHQIYARGLARYRVSDFAGAIAQFSRIAKDDPPAGQLLLRCRRLMANRPPADWGGVFDLETK